MNRRCKKLVCALVPVACLYLLAGGVRAAGSDSEAEKGQAAEPSDKTVSGGSHEGDSPATQNEDVLDRAFSPLDRAVSDINRSINKDDGSADIESDD